jgi:hypothetical protein
MTGTQYDLTANSGDRAAILRVREAIANWGRYQLVSNPETADMIITVRVGRTMGRRGVHIESAPMPTAQPPIVTGPIGTAPRNTNPPGSLGTYGVEMGPADDYVEIAMPRSSIESPLWRRTRKNGLGLGVPLIQDFRKEADAAAEHDAQKKKKP